MIFKIHIYIQIYSLSYSNLGSLFASVNASMNVIVATSNAALLDKPPPMGTFVIITASKPGIEPPKQCITPFT